MNLPSREGSRRHLVHFSAVMVMEEAVAVDMAGAGKFNFPHTSNTS